VPSRLAQQVLTTLLAARLVVEVHRPETAYAPARPLDTITAHHLLMALRATQGQELVTRDEPVRAEIYGEYARIQEAEKAAASSVTLLALVHRVQARLELTAAVAPEAKPVVNEPAPETERSAPVATITGTVTESPVAAEPVIAGAAAFASAEPGGPARPFAAPVADEDREFPL
jgi:hypothetical protein